MVSWVVNQIRGHHVIRVGIRLGIRVGIRVGITLHAMKDPNGIKK
jgi:hypothetical protein